MVEVLNWFGDSHHDLLTYIVGRRRWRL